jgi:hypothetical protein
LVSTKAVTQLHAESELRATILSIRRAVDAQTFSAGISDAGIFTALAAWAEMVAPAASALGTIPAAVITAVVTSRTPVETKKPYGPGDRALKNPRQRDDGVVNSSVKRGTTTNERTNERRWLFL